MDEYSCRAAIGGCELYKEKNGGLLKKSDVVSRLRQALSINEHFNRSNKWTVLEKSISTILKELGL